MFPASEARARMIRNDTKIAQVLLVKQFNDSLQHKVTEAAANGINKAWVEVPDEIDNIMTKKMINSLETLGYSVKLSEEEGILSSNWVKFPVRLLEIKW